MRALTTLAYAVAAALVFMTLMAAVIGAPNPDDAPQGGLTAATILRTDGFSAEAPMPREPAPERPSS